MMANIRRISAERARVLVSNGEAQLVCAYEDEDKCKKLRLEGAVTLGELQLRSPEQPPKDETLIFY
jgi:hypothetical protein